MSHCESFDAIVVGAGAAGMMCAGVAGQRGRRVLLVEHHAAIGEKIRISGGGRCNFTNIHAGPANYLSQNPHFCHSPLARYTPRDFLALVERHRIAWHEKKLGQLFCDGSSLQIVDMLVNELNIQMLQCRNIHIEVAQEVKEWLIRENFQPTYGARPMRRAIQKHITDPLSEEMLRGRFKDAQKVLVTMKNDLIEFQEEEAGVLAKV